MSKRAVLYRSRTGFTYQYSQWIAEELKCDMIENKKLCVKDIEQYDTLIIGGGVYIGSIDGFEFVQKNWDVLKEKDIYLLAVGLEQYGSRRIEFIWSRQMTREQREKVKCYYVKGGLDYSKLKLLDKMIIRIFKLLMHTTKKGQEETKGFIQDLSKAADYVSKEQLTDLFMELKKADTKWNQ